MSTESNNALSTDTKQEDKNRTVIVKLTPKEAYFVRYTAAILADEHCTDEARSSILRGCHATTKDMAKIHSKVYSAEMGWNDINWDR